MNTYGYEKMYMEKDLIEDKLYQTTPINGKIFTVFSVHLHTKYIHFMMEMEENLAYYLLRIMK